MVKFLLSLILLASSLAWGAEVLPHGGVAEAEARMVTLARDEDFFMVSSDRLAPFEMLRNMFEDETELELPKGIVTGVAFDFLKVYLDNPEATLANLASYNGSQIVDIMKMLDYLMANLDNPEIQRLNNALISQLRKNLSPEVLQRLYQALGHIPGINLSQIVPGFNAVWGSDGSRLLVNFKNNQVWRFQMYQVAENGLGSIGSSHFRDNVGFSPDGSKLWMQFREDGVSEFQVYQITNDGLVAVGARLLGNYVSWSPDGTKLLVKFLGRDDVGMAQLYQVTDDGLEARGAAVPSGSVAVLGGGMGWSLDGSKLWIKTDNNHEVSPIQAYRVADDGLVAMEGAAISGLDAGWSPDGSKLWVKLMDDHHGFKIQAYRVADNELVAVDERLLGDYAGWSPDGSKLWVASMDHGIHQIQVYQVDEDGLVIRGVADPGWYTKWSPDGSRLWVKFRDHDVEQIQIYRATEEGLVAVGEVVFGSAAGFSPDGSKLWIMFKDHDISHIQIYRVAEDELELVNTTIPGFNAGWSPDGSKFFIANEALSQITVYFDLSLIDFDQLIKRYIPGDKLSLAQQMFLMYVLQEHQRTGVIYSLPIELEKMWSFLPDALKSYLLENDIVIVNWPTVRSHDAAGLGDDSKVD